MSHTSADPASESASTVEDESLAEAQPAPTPPASLSLPRLFRGLQIVVSTTVLSRFLGMFRDIATASLFGLSPVMDAFAFAFRVPNLARRLFGEGALSAAFLPAFARTWESGREHHDQTPSWALATAVFSLLTLVLSVLVLLGELLLTGLAHIYADSPGAQQLITLTALMLPYTVLICLAAQVTAVLHALGHFTWPALVPIVLNVCWIASIFVVDPLFEPDREAQARALAVCVVLSGVLQLGLQLPKLVQLGYRPVWDWQPVWSRVREISAAVLPVTIGLSITQLTTVMDTAIAWSFSQPEDPSIRMPFPGAPAYPLTAGAASALYFAERLYHFPLGVFGVAVGTVLFPRLSHHAAAGDMHGIRKDIELGLRLILTIGLPASAGLFLVAPMLTELLYHHGHFTQDAALRTAGMVQAYAWGVWAYCAIPVLYRAFYALDDRISPLRIGLLCMLLDILLNLSLIWPLAERGLAWSTAVSSAIQVLGLIWLLEWRIGRLDRHSLNQAIIKALAATVAMSVTCWGLLSLARLSELWAWQLFVLTVSVGVSSGLYIALTRWLRLDAMDLLLTVRSRKASSHSDE